jgi:hypothetical protein
MLPNALIDSRLQNRFLCIPLPSPPSRKKVIESEYAFFLLLQCARGHDRKTLHALAYTVYVTNVAMSLKCAEDMIARSNFHLSMYYSSYILNKGRFLELFLNIAEHA